MSTTHEDEVPELIYDANTKTTYKRGRFFGKGGFARCYEITEMSRGHVYAGKVVSKRLMAKHNQREKMCQEIQIHKTLKHKHVVGFKGFFEDTVNIYIILELCRKRSLMELHRRRCSLTEPETRYYMRQILDGVKYLHENRIIHRDLKLGNLFLSEDMLVKIGDFGLATKVEYDGERKKTLCGTPNYIAPEILNKKGHSFEVDVWSIGCIMYTLLIGKPPFETRTLKETYTKIKRCEYNVPQKLSAAATHMIVAMIQSDPRNRPTVAQLLKHEFFSGYIPSSLPASALTMEPRFDQVAKDLIVPRQQMASNMPRKPLIAISHDAMGNSVAQKPTDMQANPVQVAKEPGVFNARDSLQALRDQLKKLLSTKPGRPEGVILDEMTDPQAQPLFWISKWVDYSDKYGFGYQLSDEGVGVMFNDATKIIMLSNGVNVHYIDHEHNERYMTTDCYPQELDKKIKLLSYFTRYMRDHLMKAGADVQREPDVVSRIPHLHQWCRTTSSVIMHLTNGTLQINFQDHTKVILCPLMSAVTYVDVKKAFRTFRFATIEENGCSMDLYRCLRYAHDKISMMLEKAT